MTSTVLPEVRRTELAVSLPLPGRVDVSESPLDSDGLVAHQDQVQRRMVEIFASHQAELNALRRDLHVSRLALTQAGLKPEQILEETQDVMLDGRSGVDSTASEVSWEALEDAETRPTLWVPDHAATSCMGCNTQFWFGRRKHHCRSCGRLFCGDCSEKSVAIPAEQLYSPVRVCDMCYLNITGGGKSDNVIKSCDNEDKEKSVTDSEDQDDE